MSRDERTGDVIPPPVAPCGTWTSAITAATVAAAEIHLREPRLVSRDIYWLEGRPSEGGRLALMWRTDDGACDELTPPPFDVRSRVHEYGGGAYAVHDQTAFFSNFADQRVYRRDERGHCRAITPMPDVPAGDRFADLVPARNGRLLICVRERPLAGSTDMRSEIVAIPADGSGPPLAIARGRDFFAAPRPSPDGRALAWLAWNHPLMPWDGCELWVAEVRRDASLGTARLVAGGVTESIFQPEWSADGVLHWIGDRTGWSNLYRLSGGAVEQLTHVDAELGAPQWYFGMSRYTLLADGRIACICSREGSDRLALLRPGSALQFVDLPYTAFDATLRSSGNTVVFVASSVREPRTLVRMDLTSGRREIVRRSAEQTVDAAWLSEPIPISYPGAAGRTAHALFYPPVNPHYVPLPGERPPLIVHCHGGPTSHTRAERVLETQFWTSRGFAVVDVNYSGSSGYGREYRERLRGNWGIIDAEDCACAARHLVRCGEADAQRIAIRGGSAGGYTALCALAFHPDFAAGASYFGVTDCELLAHSTHRFESRYLDGLIGAYPAARDLYRRRSPVHFADRLSCPVILFQGGRDQVVPSSQARALVDALRAKGLPVAYVEFEDEYHGLRKPANICRALEAELRFYLRVFGLALT